MNILQEVRARFEPALAGMVPDAAKLPGLLAMVKPTQDPRKGDYQANFAMPLAKQLGRKPPGLAAEVIGRLDADDMLEPPEVAGPGFINVRVKPAYLGEKLRAVADDGRMGVAAAAEPLTVVIDFSGPNVAKPLHVGHLRSTIIGDALARLFRFLGHDVITDNHLGDWGTQFGILLYGYKNHLDEAAYRADPVRELARLYVAVRKMFKKADGDDEGTADDPVATACRRETARLHAGDEENNKLWKEFMPACLELIRVIYRRMGVKFDHEHGESFYNPMLAGVAESLQAKGIAEESQGALIVRGKGEAVSLIRKRDGAFTYTTTDLATVQYRMENWSPAKLLYVVDFRQSQHFETLFMTAAKWGYDKAEFQHTKFGTVLGGDKKPLRTRDGGQIELGTLLDEAVAEAGRRYEESFAERVGRGEDVPQLGDAEKGAIAEAVGVGAVKYADLSQHRTSDYIFSYDKMLATEGNTATYMQYAYARCRAILRKAEVDVEKLRSGPPALMLDTPFEKALGLQLARFEEALLGAAEEYLPHYVTAYLWDLAKSYSGFFVNCPVLKAETPELRESRLLLCDMTARTIRKALDLLGIATLERM